MSLCVVAHWLKNYSNKKLGKRKRERKKERKQIRLVTFKRSHSICTTIQTDTFIIPNGKEDILKE